MSIFTPNPCTQRAGFQGDDRFVGPLTPQELDSFVFVVTPMITECAEAAVPFLIGLFRFGQGV
jgi:hypothetical protein